MLDVRLDEERDRYVFFDGTSLPPSPVRLYRCEIWDLELAGRRVFGGWAFRSRKQE